MRIPHINTYKIPSISTLIVLQQRSPKVTCTHTGRVTSSIIHHFKAQSVLSSELRDATFRILCEKVYGPLNLGTVIIAQNGMMNFLFMTRNIHTVQNACIRLYMIQ